MTETPTIPMTGPLLSLDSVCDYLDVSKRTAHRMIAAGELPHGIPTPRGKRWMKREIDELIDRWATDRSA